MTKTIGLILILFLLAIGPLVTNAQPLYAQNECFVPERFALDDQNKNSTAASDLPSKTDIEAGIENGQIHQSKSIPVNGRLQEQGTRRVIADTTIYIRKTSGPSAKDIVETLTTDAKGEFHCRLEPGTYTFIVAAVGYDKFEQGVEIEKETVEPLVLRMVPQTINPYQIIVRSKKKSNEVSKQQLSVEEATQIPGANRDVLASITSLPGINSVSAFNGYGNGIVIRGSAQEDSLFQVNNHSLYGGLYHLGGLESIIEPELIESIDYIAGGFSAEYGNTLGGVVDLNVKDPRTDRFGGYVNLGLLSGSFMLEGPVSEKDSFVFSLKRGFIDSYIKMAEGMMEDNTGTEFVQYPNYYDGSAIYRHEIAEDNDLKIITVAKSDALELKNDVDYVSERTSNHTLYKERFINVIGEWDYRNDKFRSLFSPMVGSNYTYAYNGERSYYKQFINVYELNEKIEYQLNDSHRLKGGLGLAFADAKIDSNSYVNEKEGEIPSTNYQEEIQLNKDFTFFYPSTYIMDQIQLGRFTLTPGINTIYDSHNEHTLFDPRFGLKYQLTKETLLKAATGLYSKMPLYDECVDSYGTKGLKPEKAIHGVLGVEHQIGENLTLDVQTYYKSFDDLVVRIDDNDPTLYGNVGTGHAYGGEILLRHQMTDHFFGWISYAYSVARRKDGPNEDERNFDSDSPHNFTTVLSYKPNRYWSFGLKYQYASGNPYTDLLGTETLYDVDTDTYYPIYNDSINEDRIRAHQQLDLRIDKYWLFDNFILSTYLDVRNVLQFENVYAKSYNADYTQSENVLSIDSYVPLIFLGVKVDF
ncbi:MAG: TonB-dependent receptor [Desulfobacteraceae bacterium]